MGMAPIPRPLRIVYDECRIPGVDAWKKDQNDRCGHRKAIAQNIHPFVALRAGEYETRGHAEKIHQNAAWSYDFPVNVALIP